MNKNQMIDILVGVWALSLLITNLLGVSISGELLFIPIMILYIVKMFFVKHPLYILVEWFSIGLFMALMLAYSNEMIYLYGGSLIVLSIMRYKLEAFIVEPY